MTSWIFCRAMRCALITRSGRGAAGGVANLPYNIATPLLISWLKQIRETPGAFDSMTLMFQKEVGERLTAEPGGRNSGGWPYSRNGFAMCMWRSICRRRCLRRRRKFRAVLCILDPRNYRRMPRISGRWRSYRLSPSASAAR